MSNNYTAINQTFWIAHQKENIQSGIIEPNENISSGLEYLETYEDPRIWNSRLEALKTNYDKAVQEHLNTLRLREPHAALAEYRWSKETGGYTLSSGALVSTTRESQAMINSTLTALMMSMLQEPIRWKGETQWLELTAEGLRGLAIEVAGHVNRCFRAEEIVDTQLATNPTLDVKTAFDAAYQGLLS